MWKLFIKKKEIKKNNQNILKKCRIVTKTVSDQN